MNETCNTDVNVAKGQQASHNISSPSLICNNPVSSQNKLYAIGCNNMTPAFVTATATSLKMESSNRFKEQNFIAQIMMKSKTERSI